MNRHKIDTEQLVQSGGSLLRVYVECVCVRPPHIYPHSVRHGHAYVRYLEKNTLKATVQCTVRATNAMDAATGEPSQHHHHPGQLHQRNATGPSTRFSVQPVFLTFFLSPPVHPILSLPHTMKLLPKHHGAQNQPYRSESPSTLP